MGFEELRGAGGGRRINGEGGDKRGMRMSPVPYTLHMRQIRRMILRRDSEGRGGARWGAVGQPGPPRYLLKFSRLRAAFLPRVAPLCIKHVTPINITPRFSSCQS